jgi:hypothetical protein
VGGEGESGEMMYSTRATDPSADPNVDASEWERILSNGYVLLEHGTEVVL